MRRDLLGATILAVAMILSATTAAPLAGQETAPPTRPPADTANRPLVPSPTGAFLRSVLVPGWGQAAYGAYLRGGIYFAAEAGSWFMLLKTIGKLNEARQIEARRISIVRDSVLAQAANDTTGLAEKYAEHPDSLAIAVAIAADSSQSVAEIRELIGARKQQREDWIALTLFWMLASGVDALVTAHLSDFPARVVAEPRAGGGLDLQVRVPTGGPP